MKKMIMVVMLVLVSASMVFAAQAKRNTGCGLGSLLWENHADGSIMSQAFQATTNATSGNQTFGITTGTSGCEKPRNFVSNDQLQEFVRLNMDSLAADIAMGGGESLTTLAGLMEMPESDRSAFYSSLQQNFTTIFPTADVEVAGVVDGIVLVANA